MQNNLWRQLRNRPRPLTSSVIAPKILNFSYFFKPLQISETEKIGKFYLFVFQSFALAEKKMGARCTLIYRQNKWWLFSIAKAPVSVKSTFLIQQESAQALFTAEDTFTKGKKNNNFVYTSLVSLNSLCSIGSNRKNQILWGAPST